MRIAQKKERNESNDEPDRMSSFNCELALIPEEKR